MTGSVDDFFQRSYSRSGSPLESEIAKELSTDFEVEHQPAYLDLDEGKSRNGDLLAKHTFPSPFVMHSERPVVAEIVLLIECKSLPDHGWIFTESNTKQICPHFSLIRSQNEITENLTPTAPLTQLIGTTSAFETILDNQSKRKKSNDQTSNVKDSSLKIIKLLRHLLNEDKARAQNLYKSFNSMSKIMYMKFYQPVIIFKGHLFVKRSAEEKIRRTNMLQFYREYRTNAYNEEATIHIVSSEHVRDYLQLIIPFYTRGVEYIVNHQDSILDAVRNDLVRWEDFNPFKIRL
jgi:hypothetical protein